MKYTSRPQEVEAHQLTIFNLDELSKWCRGSIKGTRLPISERAVDFYGRQGEVRVEIGEWIIRDSDGLFSSLSNAEFERQYLRA